MSPPVVQNTAKKIVSTMRTVHDLFLTVRTFLAAIVNHVAIAFAIHTSLVGAFVHVKGVVAIGAL